MFHDELLSLSDPLLFVITPPSLTSLFLVQSKIDFAACWANINEKSIWHIFICTTCINILPS